MTVLLALETSSDACSVAVQHGSEIFEIFQLQPQQHQRLLLPMIDEALKSASLDPQSVDAIVFGAGPGSFTGLRLACATAQGLAFALCKPVIPVSSLACLALAAASARPASGSTKVLVARDARMGDCYFACYQVAGKQVIAEVPDQLLPTTELMSRLQAYPDALRTGEGWPDLEAVTHPRARFLLTLAEPLWRHGQTVSAEQALPVYLRESVNWQKWQPKRARF